MIEFILSILGNVEVDNRPAVCITKFVEDPFAVFFWPRLLMFENTPVIPPPIAFPPSATPFGALVSTSSMPFPILSNAEGVGHPRPGKPFFEPDMNCP